MNKMVKCYDIISRLVGRRISTWGSSMYRETQNEMWEKPNLDLEQWIPQI